MSEGHKRKSHEHRKDLIGEHKWSDTGQIIFLIVFIIGMASDLFLFKLSESWQEIFPWYLRIAVLVPLFLTACFFAQKAHNKVFREERKEPIVINTDVFAIIRHPMYFGSILLYLCFVILSFSLVATVIFIMVIIFYYYICRYEEKLLIEKFGNQYLEYMKKVPMLVPFMKIKR